MEISIFDTVERERAFEESGSAAEMDIQSDDFSLEDSVHVSGTLFRNGDLTRVEGTASAGLTVQCARCLEPFHLDVSGPFSFVVKRLPLGMTVPGSEEESGKDEEEFIFVEQTVTTLDITGFVRDAIILALPIRVLCREDCRGLCVRCGHNRNEGECRCEAGGTDPRWGALNEMISNKRKQ